MHDGDDGENTDTEQNRMLVTQSQPLLAPLAFSPLVHTNPWNRHAGVCAIIESTSRRNDLYTILIRGP
jgi:hypothetical protein